MENKDNLIETYFNILNLDERASKKELELAYNSLTNNKLTSCAEMSRYREAFEYLMHNFYGVKDEGISDILNSEGYKSEEQDIEEAYSLLSPEIQASIDFTGNKLSLSDKAKLSMSLQTVNLPMFFHSIYSNYKNFLGNPIWTLEDISKILKDCCINPIVFSTIFFDIGSCCASSSVLKETKEYVKNLSKTFLGYKDLCKKFEYNITEYGVNGTVILEEDLSENLFALLSAKAENLDLYFTFSKNCSDISDI